MKHAVLAALVLGGLSSGIAFAAGSLKAEQSIEINAKADDVWATSSNFGDLGAWHPAATKTEIVEGTNNQVGAVRVITLPDGGKLKEKLEAYDAKKHTYSYTILEGVLPVSDYHSTYTVHAIGANKTKVTWKGTFNAAGASNADAVKTINGVYKGGLDNLKKISEAK